MLLYQQLLAEYSVFNANYSALLGEYEALNTSYYILRVKYDELTRAQVCFVTFNVEVKWFRLVIES